MLHSRPCTLNCQTNLCQSQSQSQSYFMTGGLLPISLSWRKAPWDPRPEISFPNWTLVLLRNILSDERIKGHGNPLRWPCDTLYPQKLAMTNLCKSKSKSKITLWLTVSQSVSLGVEPHLGLMTRYLLLYDSYGLVFVGHPLWWETNLCQSQSQSYVTTYGQSASLSWCQAPIGGFHSQLDDWQAGAGLLMWVALSDKR
jgi:hypothetical protein